MSDTPAPQLTSPLVAPPEPLPASSGHSHESQALAASPQTSSSPSLSDLDEAAKQQFLWQTHSYLNEYARFGDTKAAFAGTAAAALLGALYSAKAHIPLLKTSIGQWPFSSWLIAAALGLLIAAATIAVWTIRPRLGSTQDKGFIFWGSVAAHKKLEELQTSFHGQSARTLNDHLLHHVFDISSKVCVPKYRYVSICMALTLAGGLMGGAALMMQDLGQLQIATPPAVTAAPAPKAKEPTVAPLPAKSKE